MKKTITTIFLVIVTIAATQTSFAQNDVITAALSSPEISIEDYYLNKREFYNKSRIVDALHLDAVKGNLDAQLSLGDYFQSGDGVAKNDAVALMWYIISSENGNKDAVNKINFTKQYMAFDQITLAHKLASNWLDKY